MQIQTCIFYFLWNSWGQIVLPWHIIRHNIYDALLYPPFDLLAAILVPLIFWMLFKSNLVLMNRGFPFSLLTAAATDGNMKHPTWYTHHPLHKHTDKRKVSLLLCHFWACYQCQNKSDMETDLWWVELQCTVDTSSHAGQNDTSVSFEALRSSVNERNDGARIWNSIIIVQERNLIRPPSGKESTSDKEKNVNSDHNLFVVLVFFPTNIPFIQRLATMESSPQTMMWNSGESRRGDRRGLCFWAASSGCCCANVTQTLTPVERLVKVLDLLIVTGFGQ